MPKRSQIGRLASQTTKKAGFADKLASLTSFTAEEARVLFPRKSDRDELVELAKIVHSSASENARKARLIANISTVAGAVLKTGRKMLVGL
jgi:hypothetical protein